MTLQQMIELVQMTHPKLNSTLATELINNAMIRFAKDTYCTGVNKSVISLEGVTLDGSSSGSPVTLAGTNSLTLYAYKDDTVDSVTIKPSTSILFYTGFVQRDLNGALINVVSFDVHQDGTVYFYDVYGNPLTEFPSDLIRLEIEYVKAPTALSALSDSCEFRREYSEAITDFVTAVLYPTRSDLQIVERMQMEKHYKNRYNEQAFKALKYYRQNNTLVPYQGAVSQEFQQ